MKSDENRNQLPSFKPPAATNGHMTMDVESSTSQEGEQSGGAKKREVWGTKLDFLLSVMGYNIGLGNLLRFPYLCMKNGGGAFLIPYFFFLLTIGVPMFVMELSLGQYSSKTPLVFWESICPILKGIGWCNMVACAVFNVYYMIMMAWIMYYIVHSFFIPLPWSNCDNGWSTPQCYVMNKTAAFINGTNATEELLPAENNCSKYVVEGRRSPSEEFFDHNLLDISKGISEIGYLRWELVLCLFAAWVVVYLCLIKGVRSLGKVVYVTALGPYLLLIALLVRGLTLEGGIDGVLYYLTTDWEKLKNSEVWLTAAQQIFWSLAPAWGGTLTMASHNQFSNNIYRDAIMLPILSSLTSFFAGFVTFSFVGDMARRIRMPINCVFKSGPGLAFVVYPSAISNMPLPNAWAVLFFVLLLFLGLDSAFTTFETMYGSLSDEYPRFLKRRPWLSKLLVCAVSLLLGLPFITQGGHYLYQIIDWYQVAFMMALAFFEVIAIAYIYGTQRLKRDIRLMTGVRLTILWDIIWRVVLPLILLTLSIVTLLKFEAPSFGDYKYPAGAIAFGWFFATWGFLPLPGYAKAYMLIAQFRSWRAGKGAFPCLNREVLQKWFLPKPKWEEHRKRETAMDPDLLNRLTEEELIALDACRSVEMEVNEDLLGKSQHAENNHKENGEDLEKMIHAGDTPC